MIDWTKPIQTNDGRSAEFLKQIKGTAAYSYLIAVDCGTHEVVYYSNDSGHIVGELRVENIPEEFSGLVNFYDDGNGSVYPGSYFCKDEEKSKVAVTSSNKFVARVRVTFKSGQMDK